MQRLIVVLLLTTLVAAAGSFQSRWIGGLPLFALCALWAMSIQWLAFVPSYLKRTEVYYDLVGSLTFLSVMALLLLVGGARDGRSLLLAVMVSVWAMRLGSFLFARVRRDGSDSRFDKLKHMPLAFFTTWSMQGMWVLVTAAPAIATMSSNQPQPLTALDALAVLIWAAGFGIEVSADRQKTRFREQFGAEDFIRTGWWAHSRHPNYFGEITLWVGVSLLALPVLQGWQYLTLLSPVLSWFLLTRVSGIPLLEKKADRRWGEGPQYQAYKEATPVLVPRLFK